MQDWQPLEPSHTSQKLTEQVSHPTLQTTKLNPSASRGLTSIHLMLHATIIGILLSPQSVVGPGRVCPLLIGRLICRRDGVGSTGVKVEATFL